MSTFLWEKPSPPIQDSVLHVSDEDAIWHLLSKALHRSNADICMKKGFLGFFEKKWRNHLLCFKKILIECYASLLASTSNSTFFLCLNNFAMSSVRFILLGNLASAEKLFQSVGPSPTPFFCGWEVEIWPWTLELACGVTRCLPLLQPCAPGHCLYRYETEFQGLRWEKKDSAAARRGNFGDSTA